MPVTDEQVAAVRALLAGEFDDYKSQLAGLDHTAAPKGFNALIAAGFLEAVERRFLGKGLTRGAIVESSRMCGRGLPTAENWSS